MVHSTARTSSAYRMPAPRLPRGRGLRVKLSKIEDISGSRRVLRTPYVFQCPPLEQFTYTYGREHTPYITITKKQYLQRGARQLITCTFRTLTVEWGSFVVEHDYDLEGLRDDLLEIADEGWPFRLLATHQYGATPILSMDAVLTGVQVTENAGETDARYFDLSFIEWEDPDVQRDSNKKRKGGRRWPRTVTLEKNGDYSGLPGAGREDVVSTYGADLTFDLIAILLYGDPSLARHVAKANGISDWGMRHPLIEHPRFKGKGGKITVPAPPTELIGVVGATVEAGLG